AAAFAQVQFGRVVETVDPRQAADDLAEPGQRGVPLVVRAQIGEGVGSAVLRDAEAPPRRRVGGKGPAPLVRPHRMGQLVAGAAAKLAEVAGSAVRGEAERPRSSGSASRAPAALMRLIGSDQSMPWSASTITTDRSQRPVDRRNCSKSQSLWSELKIAWLRA